MAQSINSLKHLSDDNVTLNLQFYPQEFYYEPMWNFIGVVEPTLKDDSDSNNGAMEEDNELTYDGGGVNG